MDENLNEIEENNTEKTFSKRSLQAALITLGFYTYIILSMPKMITPSKGIPNPPLIVLAGTFGFCLLGMIMMVLSFVKKESATWGEIRGKAITVFEIKIC